MANNDALQRIRRFYKAAEARESADGYGIFLDARLAKTPLGSALVLPTRAAAELVAAEWEGQGDYLSFPEMPATRHAFTAIDRVAKVRGETAREVARFAGSDLLCYFADEPRALLDLQVQRWGPVLDWAEAALSLRFVRASGIVHQMQPPETLARTEALAAESDDFMLAGLAWGAALFGSAVLAFALLHGRLDAEEAFALSRLDEDFQEAQWGVDVEAAERAQRMRNEALLLERWFAALR